MLGRILFVAFLAGVVMLAVKSGTILRGFGLLATCDTVEVAGTASGQWQACSEGSLDGRRDLSEICASIGLRADGREYWQCP